MTTRTSSAYFVVSVTSRTVLYAEEERSPYGVRYIFCVAVPNTLPFSEKDPNLQESAKCTEHNRSDAP